MTRNPDQVSLYLGLATAIATFSAAAVALGLLHCAHSRDRAISSLVLLCGTLGVGAALATVARGRASAFTNILVAAGVLAVTVFVLTRALRLIFTVREDPPPPGYTPTVLGAPAGAHVLHRPLRATTYVFAAVVTITAAFALPELRKAYVLRPAITACSDHIDNDHDGKTDYPQDKNCDSRDDYSERLPDCSDGIDNDHDGETDYPQDKNCDSRDDLFGEKLPPYYRYPAPFP